MSMSLCLGAEYSLRLLTKQIFIFFFDPPPSRDSSFLSDVVENFAPNYGGIRSLFTEIADVVEVVFAHAISRCILKLGEEFCFLIVHQ